MRAIKEKVMNVVFPFKEKEKEKQMGAVKEEENGFQYTNQEEKEMAAEIEKMQKELAAAREKLEAANLKRRMVPTMKETATTGDRAIESYASIMDNVSGTVRNDIIEGPLSIKDINKTANSEMSNSEMANSETKSVRTEATTMKETATTGGRAIESYASIVDNVFDTVGNDMIEGLSSIKDSINTGIHRRGRFK